MKKVASLMVVLAGVLWGTSGIFVKFLTPYGFSPLQLTLCRALVSTLVIAVVLLIKDRALFRVSPKNFVFMALTGISFFGAAACYYSAMQMTSVSTAVVLMYSFPVFVVLLSVLFMGERFDKIKAIAVACVVVGCALVSGVASGFDLSSLPGILLALSASLCLVPYTLLTRVCAERGCSPLTTTFYTCLFFLLPAVLFSRPWEMPALIAQAPWPILPLGIGLGICTFILPYFLYAFGMKSIPAGTASALSISEPLAATLFSVLFFSEPMDIPMAIGVVLILLAVFLLSREETQKINKEKTQ